MSRFAVLCLPSSASPMSGQAPTSLLSRIATIKPEPRSTSGAFMRSSMESLSLYNEDDDDDFVSSDDEESVGTTRRTRGGGGGSRHSGNGKDQPLFLRKTYELLESCDQNIASWSLDGKSVIIKVRFAIFTSFPLPYLSPIF